MEKRMAVIEYRVDELTAEQARTRDRLHELESDRSTLRLVVQQMADLVKNMEAVAQRAAERTVATMLEQRAADQRTWREHLIHWAQLGLAIGATYLALHH